MENTTNTKLIIDEAELVLADYVDYNVSAVSTEYAEDINVPFGVWITSRYGYASRKYYFTANAQEAHLDGGRGKYNIIVQGEEEITLHLYNSCTCDEIYTKTGKSFDTTDMPHLEYNQDYHFSFTKAMDSCDLFNVMVDYRCVGCCYIPVKKVRIENFKNIVAIDETNVQFSAVVLPNGTTGSIKNLEEMINDLTCS